MTTCDPAGLFPAETVHTEPLASRHHALTEALADLATARDGRADEATASQRTARAVKAATDLATTIRPLIEHLPAITAALRDAANYRDDDGWCQHCNRTPGDRPCGDHANDQAIATAYRTALEAITS